MSVSTAFVVVTVVMLVLVVVLAQATASAFDTEEPGDAEKQAEHNLQAVDEGIEQRTDPVTTGERHDHLGDQAVVEEEVNSINAESDPGPAASDQPVPTTDQPPSLEQFSTAWLFANVAGTQGLFALILLGAAIWTGVSWNALGIGDPVIVSGLAGELSAGVALGVLLYAANELLATNLDQFDVSYSESLREGLAPDSVGGWVVLLAVVLPIVAGFEELLFRAAAIGALSVGLSVSPWLLLVVSTVVFAIGHGIQGPGGVLVTGLLGGVLGAAFVVTNSLLLVFVTHYVVNALEFVIHEGIGIEASQWFRVAD